MQKIKISDEVIVVAGKDKGKKGKVLKIDKKKNRVLVEGVNLVKKTIKPNQENQEGGFSEIEKSLNSSNVALICPKNGTATRVRIENKDGKKVRIAVKSGVEIK
jgi:large subunit ribosomal protein L24